MEKLTNKDVEKYLKFGELTEPFLDDKLIYDKVMCDYNNRKKHKAEANIFESLYCWIHHNVKYIKDINLRNEWKFQRTAKEIWESKQVTGCTDYAILFATFARQLNIPTTFLHTAEKNWLSRLLNNEDYKMHYGHSFCECYFEDKWILVDPTCKMIEFEYKLKEINLSYSVGGNSIFIPYFRGLDLGKKQSVKEHNDEMDKICNQIYKDIKLFRTL